MDKNTNVLVNFLRWYIDGLRQPTLNAIARLILIWSLTALAAITASVNFQTEWLNVSLSSGNDSSYFFMFLVICSLLMLGYSEYREMKVAGNSQLFKVRHMGLIDHNIGDVESYFPRPLKKIKPQAFNIEFSNSHKTDDIDSLKGQLSKIARIPEAIKESGSSLNNVNKHIVYSGVAPVPMIAAAGHAISNMQNVHIADWNRQKKKWHFSTDLDNGDKVTFDSSELSESGNSINIIIALSLPINIEKISSDFPSTENCKIYWEDNNPSYDRLSSAEKQDRIINEIMSFLNSNILPLKRDLKEVNIFVAAQVSFIFRLGATLNQGHLPQITFYHYNPDNPHSQHPWGVSFNGGIKGYKLVF